MLKFIFYAFIMEVIFFFVSLFLWLEMGRRETPHGGLGEGMATRDVGIKMSLHAVFH